MEKVKNGYLDRLARIGNLPDDSEQTQLHKRFLIYMALFMSGGGLLWGTICMIFGLYALGAIPYGYAVFTALNLLYFAFSKHFRVVRFVQVLLSLLLPFLFQWGIGGFVASGGVMLWALIALVGSISFQNAKLSIRWLASYVALTVISGIIDPHLGAFRIRVSQTVEILFFVVNTAIISSIVTGLMLYFTHQRDRANAKLVKLKEQLEVMVQDRTTELREALAHLTAIVDNIADGLVVTDNKGMVTRVNPALKRMYPIDGGTPQELNIKELMPNLAGLIDESCHTKAMSEAEVQLPRSRTGKAVTNPINEEFYDEKEQRQRKECIGSVTVIRDITREKEIDGMKTDFISNVSHELRTPLTSVLGFAKIIGKKLEDVVFPKIDLEEAKLRRSVEQVRGNIGIIVSEGERLTSLINDVLDISKMEAGKIEWKIQPNSLAEIITQAAGATTGLFAHNENVELVTKMDPDLPVLEVDRDRIIQVIVNLISNASKFTEAGSVTVAAEVKADEVIVSVTDTGMGIKHEDQAQVFEKFKQVGDTLTDKPKGTGLGLPICKQIIEHHGGRIGVESEIGEGSTFYFTLPLQKASTDEAEERIHLTDIDTLIRGLKQRVTEARALEGSEHQKTILVVDDDDSIRSLLRQELEEDGYQVEEAPSGSVALEYLQKHKPDLIILDIMMPGMNGFDIATLIKNNPATMDIPIMIHSIIEDKERGYRLGVDRYLTKPINMQLLMREVSELIELGPSRKKVLVLDENESTVKSLVDVLSAKGYQATGAYDGAAGIEKAKAEKPDMIIMDSLLSDKHQIMQTLRFEKDLENLFFIVLGGNNANEEDQPEATPQK